MLQQLSQIAPLSTWAYVVSAAFLMLCGFVALGHAKVTKQAYGATYQGVLSAAQYETMIRWTIILLASAFLLWGLSLHWPTLVLGALAAVVGLTLLMEIVARVRG